MAYAAKVRGERVAVLTTFGDGGTSTGDFHAAMNFAGVFRLPVVFFCENNRYAISHPVERQTASGTLAEKAPAYGLPGLRVDGNDVLAVRKAVGDAMERARAGEGGTLIEALTYRIGPHSTSDDPTVYRSEDEVAAWRGKDPIRRFAAFLERRGLLEDPAAEEAEAKEIVRRTIEAAEGAPPCRRPACSRMSTRTFHGTSPSSATPCSPGRGDAMGEVTLIKAINDALATEMARDPSVCLLGEDIGRDGGVFRATEGLLHRFGTERVIDTPLNEAGIVGMAIGMAMNGLRPVAEIEFSDFIYPAFDQIVSEMAKMRYRSAGQFTAAVVLRAPSGGGIRGGHYHSQSPEAYYIHTAGLVVVMPSTPADAKGLLSSAIRGEDPVIFLEPKALYRTVKGEVPEGEYLVPLGKGRIVRPGDDVTLIAWGGMVPVAEKAAATAASEGVSVEIIDPRTLWPLDIAMIEASVKRTGRAVVLHEAPRTCGFGAESLRARPGTVLPAPEGARRARDGVRHPVPLCP